MKPGTQADLRRHLATECGIEVTKQAISLLVKAKDYRIIKTPQGKIKIEESAKALVDSGFGKRSATIKRLKENRQEKPAKAKKSESILIPTEEDLTDYITGKKKVTLASPPHVIHRYKEFQQAEKERINNETRLKKLIDVDEVGEKSFNLWRQVRDEIQTLKDRTIIKLRAAESDHEAEQVFNKEIHRILNSIVTDFDTLTDSDLKKKLVSRLIK